MKLLESNIIFVNFHTRLQSTDFIVVVLVLRPRLNSDFEDEDEHEDEYDNNQIKSTANVLTPETSHETCQDQSFFFDQTGRFFGQRQG